MHSRYLIKVDFGGGCNDCGCTTATTTSTTTTVVIVVVIIIIMFFLLPIFLLCLHDIFRNARIKMILKEWKLIKSERSLQFSHTGVIVDFPCLPCHICTHFKIELLIEVKITPTSTIHLDKICFYVGRS